MLEQIDTKLEQEDRTIQELRNLLLEEIELRKQDQLKIAQLESTITEWKTELEGKMSAAFAGIHMKLDQLQRILLSQRGTLSADTYNQLIQHQNPLTRTEQNFKFNKSTLKGLIVPEDDVIDAKLSNLDLEISKPGTSKINISRKTDTPNHVGIRSYRDVGFVQATPNINSTNNSATSPKRTYCYMNWDDNIHGKLTEPKFVKYKELDEILYKICAKRRTITPEDMSKARTSILALKVSQVNKYQRFPSTGNFIDINLNSKRKTKLKKMFETTNGESFYEAAKSFKNFIEKNSVDQWLFEDMHDLQWTL